MSRIFYILLIDFVYLREFIEKRKKKRNVMCIQMMLKISFTFKDLEVSLI